MSDDDKQTRIDEKLISLVRQRPCLYDLRVPQKDRTKLIKQVTWAEVSKCMHGELKPDAAESRWKYLRENYIKARRKHKMKEELARRAGYVLPPRFGKNGPYSFRYHHLMEFLNDSLDYQKNLTLHNVEKARNRLLPKLRRMARYASQKDNLQNGTEDPFENTEPPKVQFVPVPQAVTIDNFEEVDVDMKFGSSVLSNQTLETETSDIQNKEKVSSCEQMLLELLQKPIEKPSPIDGFLLRLGEGLRRLPYRERSKIELEFLTRLHQVEEELGLFEENE